MNRTRTARKAATAVALLALAAIPAGCVVAIGNDTADRCAPGSKISLTAAEREELPVIESRSEIPTIREKYSEQLSTLGPNTTFEQFKQQFPQAQFVERKDNSTDAYSVELRQKYRYRTSSYGYLARDEAWFFFRNGTFVKWGSPHDWP
ncbi:MAG: hypothetical protein JSR77_01480 [Planctomycetes bacterium]|nr:hypothetical protein [Planctomycetota bacterium]